MSITSAPATIHHLLTALELATTDCSGATEDEIVRYEAAADWLDGGSVTKYEQSAQRVEVTVHLHGLTCELAATPDGSTFRVYDGVVEHGLDDWAPEAGMVWCEGNSLPDFVTA